MYWWGGHCCPLHCDLFEIYCAPPNLGISRTWICRLNFTQRPIFSGLKFFNETRDPRLKSPAGLVLSFFTSWKIHRPQQGLNPWTSDHEASTLPRDMYICMYMFVCEYMMCSWIFLQPSGQRNIVSFNCAIFSISLNMQIKIEWIFREKANDLTLFPARLNNDDVPILSAFPSKPRLDISIIGQHLRMWFS